MSQYAHDLAETAHDIGSDKDRCLGPHAILARRNVPELQALAAIRRKGWEEESLDYHFQWQRDVADNPNDRVAFTWFQKMKKVMQEVDYASDGCIPVFKSIEFLDVGCSSGSFSSYVLRKNRGARGVGISLPVEQGGHPWLLEERFASRYQYISKDMLEYDLQSLNSGRAKFDFTRRFPGSFLSRFPLVFVNEHARRTYHIPGITELTADEWRVARGAYRDSLLIAQIIIALEAVSPGGTIVARLSHVECCPSAQLLYLFDHLSDQVSVHKPRAMHASRGTCYVVAKGVGGVRYAKARQQYLTGLRELLVQLKHGGPDGRGRMLIPADLDFIVTTNTILEDYLDRLIDLSRGVWSTQVDGLQHLFHKKGIQ